MLDAPNFLDLLRGGDRRSVGQAEEAVERVLNSPALFDAIIAGMLVDEDPVLRMRCADVAEKVSRKRPELLLPHKSALLGPLARIDQADIRWHVAPMLARLPLDALELRQVTALLIGWLNHTSSIVKTMSMQALADLAERHEGLRPEVLRHLRELTVIGTPAMKARGRKLLKRLDHSAR